MLFSLPSDGKIPEAVNKAYRSYRAAAEMGSHSAKIVFYRSLVVNAVWEFIKNSFKKIAEANLSIGEAISMEFKEIEDSHKKIVTIAVATAIVVALCAKLFKMLEKSFPWEKEQEETEDKLAAAIDETNSLTRHLIAKISKTEIVGQTEETAPDRSTAISQMTELAKALESACAVYL